MPIKATKSQEAIAHQPQLYALEASALCPPPFPHSERWLPSSPLHGWCKEKMVSFVLHPAQVPVARARRRTGRVRARAAPRVHPSVQQEQSLLPQYHGSVVGWTAAHWLSRLQFAAILYFEITAHSNKTRWICSGDKWQPETMPCGISSLFFSMSKITLTLQKRIIRTY